MSATNQVIGDKTYPFAAHTAWGYVGNLLQNVIEYTGAYTHHKKVVSAASAGSVLASTAGSTAKQTITTGITNPDVPRVLAVTLGGSGFSADSIVINGINVEGKPISDTIAYTTSTGQVIGSLVFKRVTSVVLPSTLGTSATITVDTTDKIGLNHRCVAGKTATVAVYATHNPSAKSNYPITNRPTLDGNITGSNYDNQFVEKNYVTTSTTPDGSKFWYYFYWFTKVLVEPPKDSPDFYSTTTSTSTSSTSTSTSTSQTTTSTSTSSTSTSQTTTSTSSTSTSTTTLPV